MNAVTQPRSDVLQGTLDLMVLKTLDTLGAMHGYGIAQRIQQVSENLLQLNQGTLYPALLRLEQRGWITSKWGTSENNRRARFYSLTKSGRKQLAREAEDWQRIVGRHGPRARIGGGVMGYIRAAVIRAWAFVTRRRRRTRTSDDELAFHREMLEADLRRQGLSPAEARREAGCALGGRAQIGESYARPAAVPGARVVPAGPSLRACAPTGARPASPSPRS